MANYLDDTAEALAPAPAGTNFFDPAPGQNVISRYGNARALAEDMGVAAKLEGDLNRNQFDRERLRTLPAEEARRVDAARRDEERHQLDMLTADREDFDFKAKQESGAAATDFMRNVFKNIDPKDPEARKKLTGALVDLPGDAYENAVVKGGLTLLTGMIDDEDKVRTQTDRLKFQREKLNSSSILKAKNIQFSDEEWKTIPIDPDTGLPDHTEVAIRTGQKMAAATQAETEAKNAAAAGKVTAANTKSRTERFNKQAADGIKNLEAFPDKVDILAKQAGTDRNNSTLKKTPEYAKAEAWDKAKLENEEAYARELADTMGDDGEEEYVRKGGEIGKAAQKLRRNLYRKATSDTGLVDAGTPAAPAAETPAAAAPTKEEPQERRTVGGKSLVKIGGKWFEE